MSALDWTDVIAEQSLRRRRPYPEEATIADLVNLGWSEGRARGYMARSIRGGTAVWEWALDDNGKKVKVYRRLAPVPALPAASGGNGTDGRRDGGSLHQSSLPAASPRNRKGKKTP